MSQGGVLIVDDDLALLEALPEALRLRMGGVTVETADSAAEALERIAARDCDAIVADIKIAARDGLDLLTETRTRRPDTPTLMTNGHADNELVVDDRRAGACASSRWPPRRSRSSSRAKPAPARSSWPGRSII